MARTSTKDLTAAEVNVVQGLEPLGSALQVVRVNAGRTALEYATSGAGDALTANPLSQFAATTSLELKGVISDETGSGALVFATSPTLVTPVLGTPTSGTLTNCTGLPVAGITASTSTALGVGSIELGHASDTSITRVSAGVIAVEGATIPTLTSTSTFATGVKTFLAGMFALRNVANTFNALFTNTNTADRTYTLKDANGTLAFTSDITGTNSGTNTGDQTITLTGAVTGSGTGSFATTIATPGTNTVSSTNSTATAHTHAITSSSAPGAAASLLATDASGHIGSTGTRIVKLWATDITATNAIAGSITGNAATVTTNANLTGHITSTGNAAVLGSFTMAQLDTAISDGNVVYQSQALGTPASGTLTNCTGLPVAGITASTSTALGVGSIELGHASDTTISRVSAGVIAVEGSTVPTLSVANTWTATQTEKAVLYTNDAITAAANAATIPVTYRLHTVTNNSAATLTITLTTAGATDGQMHLIRILDFSAVAQTITWVNTENSSVTAPTTSNGSTTLFLTVGFIYNGATSKWRCISYA